MNLEENNGNF
jgi:hypothetical protein